MGFCAFVWYEDGSQMAIEYLSAYLMEWSLSIDNIFVFILIFGFFKIKETSYARVLLIGILMAIVFRAIFITVGVALISQFGWILYIFGAILVYTGVKMFIVDQHEIQTGRELRIPLYAEVHAHFQSAERGQVHHQTQR